MTTAERYRNIIAWFRENMPEVGSELHYNNAYELLVAVILSAQCTDKRVNMVAPALIERFPTPHHMAQAEPEDIYPYIKSVSYPNSKAQHLSGMARKLVSDFGGVVPDDLEALQTLPGVGRKTANVVGIVIFNKSVMPVDTHVFRVSDRLGLTTGAKNPLQAEMQLTEGFPAEYLPVAHHWLILHGRYVCLARKPRCEACGLTPWCRYYAAQQKAEKTVVRKKTDGAASSTPGKAGGKTAEGGSGKKLGKTSRKTVSTASGSEVLPASGSGALPKTSDASAKTGAASTVSGSGTSPKTGSASFRTGAVSGKPTGKAPKSASGVNSGGDQATAAKKSKPASASGASPASGSVGSAKIGAASATSGSAASAKTGAASSKTSSASAKPDAVFPAAAKTASPAPTPKKDK